MSTHRSLKGFWGSCAVSLSAILLTATTPARADEIVVYQASASAQSPIGETVVPKSGDSVIIDYGSASSGTCGALIILHNGETKTYQFVGSNGCNPVSVTANTKGGILVTTQSGGADGKGLTITFTANLGIISSQPAGSSLVGATIQVAQTGDLLRANARTGTTNVFITGSYPIYEAQLSSNGILSTPVQIFAFSTDGKGGFAPYGPAVMGADGNLYGTTNQGGAHGFGTAYKLVPSTREGTTTWSETVLHAFTGGADGGRPEGQVAIDSAGNLYGTTSMGGELNGVATNCQNNGFAGCGIVFRLDYNASKAPWRAHVLYAFTGAADGALPETGVVLDAKNNVYGTTFAGGNTGLAACSGAGVENMTPGCGVVFKLTALHHKESVLYAFMGGTDGAEPLGPVSLAGKDIFGTTVAGGSTACPQGLGLGYAVGCGVVFEITP